MHRHGVGVALVGGEMGAIVSERVEAMNIMETLLTITVTALDLVVLLGNARGKLVADSQFLSDGFER